MFLRRHKFWIHEPEPGQVPSKVEKDELNILWFWSLILKADLTVRWGVTSKQQINDRLLESLERVLEGLGCVQCFPHVSLHTGSAHPVLAFVC